MFGQRREGLAVNGVESLALRPERRVESAGRLGNRLQARLTEVRLYELAGVVFYEAAALFRRNRNQVTVRRAHTDRADL